MTAGATIGSTLAGPPTIISEQRCREIAERVFGMATGGGITYVGIFTTDGGNLRWARNTVTTGGDTRAMHISINRAIRGVVGRTVTNTPTEAMLQACVERAEAIARFGLANLEAYPETPPAAHAHVTPQLWFDRTLAANATMRAQAALAGITPAEREGLLSAGYIQASGQGMSVCTSDGLVRYYQSTTAQYSMTVRIPDGTGSGWTGVDWNDWGKIDAHHLAQTATEKCLASRDPVAIEPGRYVAILEPQAVCDLVAPIVDGALRRTDAEEGKGPFAAEPGRSKIGEQVIDARITLSADPMDPECSFVPFDWAGEPYLPTKWIADGVLRELWYPRWYGLQRLGKDIALPNSTAFRLSGGTTSVDDMIANTRRGVLVTRFNNGSVIDGKSMLMTGNTRDGLWLIQNGKVTKPIKNFRYTESPLFVLNNIEAMGVPQRVFRPDAPAVVPPLMVRDFSFTGLMDAV